MVLYVSVSYMITIIDTRKDPFFFFFYNTGQTASLIKSIEDIIIMIVF